MAYTRTTTVDTSPGGDSVLQGVTDLDTDLTNSFTNLNTHEALTATHGATGAVVGTTNTQTLTNKTLTSPKINENVALSVTATQLNSITAKAPLASPTFTGVATLVGVKETAAALAANDIDLATGSVFTKTISGNTTLTVSNPAATGLVSSFILELTNGGSATITWWSGIKWAGGVVPTWTTSGLDVIGFYTHDGGTTWRGSAISKDSK